MSNVVDYNDAKYFDPERQTVRGIKPRSIMLSIRRIIWKMSDTCDLTIAEYNRVRLCISA